MWTSSCNKIQKAFRNRSANNSCRLYLLLRVSLIIGEDAGDLMGWDRCLVRYHDSKAINILSRIQPEGCFAIRAPAKKVGAWVKVERVSGVNGGDGRTVLPRRNAQCFANRRCSWSWASRRRRLFSREDSAKNDALFEVEKSACLHSVMLVFVFCDYFVCVFNHFNIFDMILSFLVDGCESWFWWLWELFEWNLCVIFQSFNMWDITSIFFGYDQTSHFSVINKIRIQFHQILTIGQKLPDVLW